MVPATLERPGTVADTCLEVPAVAKRTVEERFWAKVDRNGPVPKSRPDLGPCWVWTARLVHGYGSIWICGVDVRAHRFSYEMLVGPIPEGLELDHLCRVTVCVNPAHLEPVTHKENLLRGMGWGAKNARKTHCSRGHSLIEENSYYASSSGGRQCKTCSREAGQRSAVEKRRAAFRLLGVAGVSCEMCGELFANNRGVAQHKVQVHRGLGGPDD